VEFLPKRKEQIYCSHSCAAHYKGVNKRGKKLPKREGWVYSKATTDKDGYIRVYAGNHPFANGRKMIQEHILIMEQSIGRALLPAECVHHINESKQDNRLESLRLMTKSEHSREHAIQTAAVRERDAGGRFA